MPTSNMDFLQALAALLRGGVTAELAIVALDNARRNDSYTLVERFDSCQITYTKQGWTIAAD